MRYAGFWKRLGALLIDGLLLAPCTFAIGWLGHHDRHSAMLVALPQAAFGWLYELLLIGRFGQTLGKMAMGIEVRRVDGQRVDWVHAFRRAMVQCGLSIASAWAEIAFLVRMRDGEFDKQWSARLLDWPVYEWITGLAMAWALSEVVVLMFNRRRRALHDYLGGTVVALRGHQNAPGELPPEGRWARVRRYALGCLVVLIFGGGAAAPFYLLRKAQGMIDPITARECAAERAGTALPLAIEGAQTIDLDFKDVDTRVVLNRFSGLGGMEVMVMPNVEGMVTVRLKDTPWDKALDQIARDNGLALFRSGKTILVTRCPHVQSR
jgi:uncharacterized RDD family membrane protein YckC